MKIKSKLLFFTLLVAISLNSFCGGLIPGSRFSIGAYGSVRFSGVTGYPDPIKRLVTPGYGISFNYNIHPEISLRTGVSMIQNGFAFDHLYIDDMDTVGMIKVYNKYSYLNLPLEISYNLGRNKFNVYLSAGADFNFMIRQNTYSKFTGGFYNDPFNADNSHLYKKFDFALMIGLGFEYRIKPGLIVFSDFKYHHGMSDILKNYSEFIIKHKTYSINIGVRLGIRSRRF